MKKKSSLRFVSLICFQVSKILTFFSKFTVDLVLKSFSGRNNSAEALVFGLSNSLPYDLEESREFREGHVNFWKIYCGASFEIISRQN